MSIKLHLPPIIHLDGNRCIVVNDYAEIDFTGDAARVVSCGPLCVETLDGYVSGQPPLWLGAVLERLHPWPLV